LRQIDKWTKRKFTLELLNSDQAMHILGADKVPWHTITYVPGKRVSIPVENGQAVLLNGSISIPRSSSPCPILALCPGYGSLLPQADGF
jgi:hypothetical protein